MSAQKSVLLIPLIALLASACIFARPVRDHFPMKNPTTGQQVTCYSGEYWYEESGYDLEIADQCRNACERYGFVWQGGNEYYKPNPKAPDEDMRQFIPAACLP